MGFSRMDEETERTGEEEGMVSWEDELRELDSML